MTQIGFTTENYEAFNEKETVLRHLEILDTINVKATMPCCGPVEYELQNSQNQDILRGSAQQNCCFIGSITLSTMGGDDEITLNKSWNICIGTRLTVKDRSDIIMGNVFGKSNCKHGQMMVVADQNCQEMYKIYQDCCSCPGGCAKTSFKIDSVTEEEIGTIHFYHEGFGCTQKFSLEIPADMKSVNKALLLSASMLMEENNRQGSGASGYTG